MNMKLNVGCGKDIRRGFINIDIVNIPGVDGVCDINDTLPFSNNSFDYIVCHDILEHVYLGKVLKELYRVLEDNGIIEIRVPHFTSSNNFIDPTHIKMFSFRTFDFFVNNKNNRRDYYYDFHFQKIIKCKITFLSNNPINWPFIFFVNINNYTKKIYEETFLRNIAPAHNIEIQLKK